MQLQTAKTQRQYWQILQIFSDYVATDFMPGLEPVKKIFAAIGRQIRHLDDPHPTSLTKQLIREVLFEIATSKIQTILDSQISNVFGLAFQFPVDYEIDFYEPATANDAAITISFSGLLAEFKKATDKNFNATSLQLVLAPLSNQLSVAAIDKFSVFSSGLKKLGVQLAEGKMTQQGMVSLTAWVLLLEQGLANDLTALDWLESKKNILTEALDEIADIKNFNRINHTLCSIAITLDQQSINTAVVASALQLLSAAERKIEEAMQAGQFAEIFISVDAPLAKLAGVCDLIGADQVKKNLQQMCIELNELAISTDNINNLHRCEELALQFLILVQQVEKIHLIGIFRDV